ncbi:uncharacterized protein CIMG_01190 [Coccidioides immitis RS]|uniref:NmrA-like domain-containing protein n=1 Tax=Coccidioides immitis (strain RS) TaxID=246410 RepID=J3KIM9_COCIM|nr:uncharacterized protein CIMG_01190 [Coccidioides immitis RS]EAS35836.3 hypothetical protein CIMG_01190 [Coccidioides immitis RS]
MPIHNVAIVGADGELGPSVLKALASSGHFNVTVLKRKSSTSNSTYPQSVQTVFISDDFPADELVAALKGIDAVVVTVNGTLADLQKRIADAAVTAGVKHFIPADFGSCDSQDQLTRDLVPLYQRKADVREYLRQLASRHENFSWTGIVCGHFFHAEALRFMHIDIRSCTAEVLDDGETRCSASTLPQVGAAVVKVLEKSGAEEIKNKVIYIQSFCATQMEVVRAFERATGQSWKVNRTDPQSFVKEEKAKADANGIVGSEELVWVLGTLHADWEKKEEFVNKFLGLDEEDLDKVVAGFVA